MNESPGLALCEESEGYARDRGDGWVVAYWDPYGCVWTIGMGSTGPDIKNGTTWTREHAVQRLQQGWDSAQAGVLRASPILRAYPLMLDALTDFAYNEGIGRYQSSTLRRYVNQQRWQDAAGQFARWNLAQGKIVPALVRRRAKERALFLSQLGSDGKASPSENSPQLPATSTPSQSDGEGQSLPIPSLPTRTEETGNTASPTLSRLVSNARMLASSWLTRLAAFLQPRNPTSSRDADQDIP